MTIVITDSQMRLIAPGHVVPCHFPLTFGASIPSLTSSVACGQQTYLMELVSGVSEERSSDLFAQMSSAGVFVSVCPGGKIN